MPQYFAIMLNYARVWWESYYAQNYAGIMCQGLLGSCIKCSSKPQTHTVNHDTLEFGYAVDHMVYPAWTDFLFNALATTFPIAYLILINIAGADLECQKGALF